MVRTDFLYLLLLPSLFLVQACTGPLPTNGLVDGRLRPCPASPNCVNSETAAGPSAIVPLTYTGNAGPAWQNLRECIEETGGRIVDSTPIYLWAVYTSPVLRFKDDVEFHLDEAAKTIQVRSASRVGYWDLGVNRRRVEKIRRIFTAKKQD